MSELATNPRVAQFVDTARTYCTLIETADALRTRDFVERCLSRDIAYRHVSHGQWKEVAEC